MAASKVIGIVAWSLVVILAIGLIAVAVLGQQQAGKASALSDALVQVAAATGMEELDPETLPDAAQQVQESIRATRLELATAKDELTAAQDAASSAQGEVSTLTQNVQEQTGKAESLFNELAAAKDELAAAQTAAEEAKQEAEEAAQAAEKKTERLEKTIDRLKAEKEEEVARLEAEIEALRQPPPELEMEGIEGEAMEGEDAMGMMEMPGGDVMVVEEEMVAEPMPEPEMDMGEGRIIGQSEMFSQIRYGEDRTLAFRLHDGQTLVYQDVPADVADKLVSSENTLDVAYRFKIQGNYKCLPPDSVVIRKYWKWYRRHKPYADVRYVEPAAPAAGEEAVVVEEAPAEEAVE